MKFCTIIFSLILLYIPGALFAQAPNFDWVRQAGEYSSSDYGNNVAVDKSGNVFVTGSVNDIIDFGGDYVLNSYGSSDVFLAKYDSSGNILWAKHSGSQSYDYGSSVAIDKDGNVYVTGVYSDSANFDSNILRSYGEDAFLAKYSTNGQLLWIRHGGGEYDDYSYDVTTDKQGNVIIIGGYQYSAVFDSVYLDGPGINDVFIIKYDSQGNILWARNGGGDGYNVGNSIATDSQNDILIAGVISDTVTFDINNITSFGTSDAMIAKYDPSGNLIWIKHAGGSGNYDYAEDISVDRNDNIYFTGYFSGIVFFGTIQISSQTSTDLFTAKYDINGNPLWVKRDSYYGYNYGGSIASDPAGNITVTATAYSPGYIPPPKNQVNKMEPNSKKPFQITSKAIKHSKVTSEDQYLYIVRYNKDGNKMWDKAVYSSGDGGIADAPNGDLILTGDFYDQVYFDSLTVTSIGYPDVFVARIPSPKISIPAKSVAFGFKSLSDTTHYIAIGDTASKYIEIKNTSKAYLHFFNTSVIAPKNDFSLDPLSQVDSLPPYQSAYLHINYIAKDISSDAIIQIASDASTSPDTIKLIGYGAPVPLVYQSDSLNFGTFDVKDSLAKTLIITNNGAFTVKLLGENLSNQTDFISDIFNGTVPDSIKPHTSNNYIIKFNPQSAGIKTGRLIINNNSSHYQDTIYLSGTGILRTLTFSKKQINFGNVDVGDSLTNSITITNSGTVDIAFLNKNLTNNTDYHLSEISIPDTIHPGKSKLYNIKFHPPSSGIKTGKLILSSNAKSSPDTINLTGTAVIRAITFSSKQINFGNVDVGGSLEKSVTITNSGTVDIIFSGKSLTEKNDFTLIDSSVTDTIHALKSNNYIVKFNPESSGIKTGKLIFTSNSKTSPDTVTLNGTGIRRELTFSTREVNFGNVDVGSSLVKTVTVTNNGTVNIIFSNKTLTNQTDFYLSGISVADTIQPGKSKDFNFSFIPKTSGNKTGKLIFASNSQSSPDTVNLLGTGIVRALTFSSKQINYGDVDVNGWLEKTISLTNNGTVDIIISNKNLINKTDFTLLSSSIPDTINPLKSKDYIIKFNPVSAGVKSTLMVFTSNSKTSPDTVELSGNGIQRTLTFSTREINFGNVEVGNSYKDSIIVTNNGTVNIIFSNKILTNQNDFGLSEISVPDTILPGKSKVYNFNFSPKSSGSKTGELIFSGNSQSSPDTVNLIGNGIIQNLTFSSRKINYGNVDVGGELDKSLTVTNGGTVDIIFSKISLTDQVNFSLINISVPDTIHPNNSKIYHIRFNPKIAEFKTADLIFISNLTSNPDTVSLTGTGILRAVTFSTRQLDYGNVNVGTSIQRSITITNNGSVDIIFSNKSLTNKTDFSLLDSSVPDTLHPEISKQYRINFSPKSAGNKTGKIIFTSNSEAGADTLTLTGNGTSALMSLSGNQIEFGSIDINQDSISTLKISNAGTGSLIISNYSITGTNSVDFTISNNIVPDTILPGNSRNINIKFAPQTSGNKTASLLIVSNLSSLPDTVGLSGKGASAISVEVPVNNNVGQNTNLTANPPQGFNFTSNKLYYRRTGESIYQQADLTLSNDTYRGVIPASYSTIRGIQYYIVFSEPGYTVTYPANNPVNNPANIAVSVPEYTYPTVIKNSVYQMISIPLLISDPVIDSVLTSSYGAYDNTKWRVLRWNPSTNSYSEYPDLNGNLMPGNAFWLIENEGKSFNVRNAVTVSSSGNYSVNLQPGWNQVGDPYAFSVDWDSVINTSQVQLPIHWNSDIEDYEINQRILQPWDGYWVFNPDTGLISIIFRPIESNGIPKNKKERLKRDEFVIQLKARIENTNIIDAENYVGMLESAEEGKDKYNVLAPPSITGNLSFNVVSGDTEYAENIVAPSKEGAYWDIRLSSNQKDKNMIVELDTTEMPADFKIWFLDRERKMSIPINGNKIRLPVPHSGKGSYRIITGNEEYAKEHSENIPLAPLEYSLSQNYPNPFNPSTNINYQLKEISKVTLEIFNILGQRVRVLIDNELENPGEYRVMWDGTNGSGNRVATGVYIYRLRANSFVSSKKMILLK